MMFCTKCGTQLSDDLNFCTQCGTPLKPANSSDRSADPTVTIAANLTEFPSSAVSRGANAQPGGPAAATQKMPSQPAMPTQPAAASQPAAAFQPNASVERNEAGQANDSKKTIAIIAGVVATILVVVVLVVVFVVKPGSGSDASSASSSQTVVISPEPDPEPEEEGNSVTLSVKTATGESLTGEVRRDDNGYVLADSSDRVYSEGEISDMNLSGAELCIAWNEPFARQGYHFKNPDLQRYFESCSWYVDSGNQSSLYGAAATNNGTLRSMAERNAENAKWMELATS